MSDDELPTTWRVLIVRAWPEANSPTGVRFRMLASNGADEREHEIVAIGDSPDDIADAFRMWARDVVERLGDDAP